MAASCFLSSKCFQINVKSNVEYKAFCQKDPVLSALHSPSPLVHVSCACVCVCTRVCVHVCVQGQGEDCTPTSPRQTPTGKQRMEEKTSAPSMVTTATPTPQLSPACYPSLQCQPSLSPLKKPCQEW